MELTGGITRHFNNTFALSGNLPVVEGAHPYSYFD